MPGARLAHIKANQAGCADAAAILVLDAERLGKRLVRIACQRQVAGVERGRGPLEQIHQRRHESLVRPRAVLVIVVIPVVSLVPVASPFVDGTLEVVEEIVDIGEQRILPDFLLEGDRLLDRLQLRQKGLTSGRRRLLGHGPEDAAQLVGRAGRQPPFHGIPECFQ